jgi:hypothetical protein
MISLNMSLTLIVHMNLNQRERITWLEVWDGIAPNTNPSELLALLKKGK